ncbi:MAG: hypothetical protein A2864_00570 [Candidatus Woykebacteria bacterium RIFCSPHIGHO2_01_FULL_39_12]|uniref:Uncharacterized protein n=1 Tax=Candidatus Woykebacteria bacterium RIFCSPHIGHO2_01_FULL_39_12 TaxID=1802599 RepID=A0A1G1WJ07_9BACT|nr:MAG: hypothetical protein A2864_00570 [Candidatus Woykebacteria bacterium RIFCSPHIGHO2_01_FULL_39_12]
MVLGRAKKTIAQMGYGLPRTDAQLIKRYLVRERSGQWMVADTGIPASVVVDALVRNGWDIKATKENVGDLSAGQVKAVRALAQREIDGDLFTILRRRWLTQIAGTLFQASGVIRAVGLVDKDTSY